MKGLQPTYEQRFRSRDGRQEEGVGFFEHAIFSMDMAYAFCFLFPGNRKISEFYALLYKIKRIGARYVILNRIIK